MPSINHAPTITSNGGGASATVDVPENTTAVTTVTATDPDAGTTLHYSLAGGADVSLFHIDDATGVLSFAAIPDFEAPADADHDNSYQVVVRASDGNLSDDQGLAVNVSDVSEPLTRFGSEFLVNSTTLDYQYEPSVAAYSDGRFVVAWTDLHPADDGSGGAIQAQIFGATGAKVGVQFLVNTTTPGLQTEPTVATLSDGRFVVAWSDYSSTGDIGGGPAVRAQIFNFSGIKSGSELLISTTSEAPGPFLAGLADGRFVAAWSTLSPTGPDGDAEGIRAQVFNSNGTKSGAEFQVNTTTIGAQFQPAISLLADGDFVVTWTDLSGTGGDQSQQAVRAQIFNPSGAPVGSEFLVNTTTIDNQNRPTITSLTDGRFVAAWTDLSETGADTDGRSVRAQVFNADGTKSGTEFLANTTTASDQQSPTIAGLLDGRFVAAWTSGNLGSNQAIRAQVFNSDGTKSSAEFVVDANNSLHMSPKVAALADGRFIVTWADMRQAEGDLSGTGVRAQIFDPREGPMHLTGTPHNDDFIGTPFNDTMRGAAGNDHLDGGAGDDTAIFSQSFDKYTVQALGGGNFMVSGPDGTDTLTNFEHLQFADGALDLGSFNAGNLHVPQIASDGGGDAATLSVSGHATAVTTVSAIDADPGTTLNYAISGGPDAGAFVIEPATGALAFATAPDFAGPTDADHNNSYIVQVRASDGSLSATQTITVNVANVSEAPTTITLTGTPGDDTFTALPGNERIDALGGNDTVSFNFRLVDATVTYQGNQIIIDGPGSHTVLTGFETYAFTDGTVNNNDGGPLVDDLFYYSRYHDVWNAHVDADQHYHQQGWHEFRNPNALFDTGIYLSLNPGVRAAGLDPLLQFDQVGWKDGRVPSFAFDGAKYLGANPDVAAAHVDPLAHFLANGAGEGRQPFAVTELLAANGFDYVYYLATNPDVAAAHVDPFQHFETTGWKEGRNPNAWFDSNGYLAAYSDVAAAGINPLDHYAQFGWHEGRDPSTHFDTSSYLAAYPDVVAAQMDPLVHFLANGIHEGRSQFADGVWG